MSEERKAKKWGGINVYGVVRGGTRRGRLEKGVYEGSCEAPGPI